MMMRFAARFLLALLIYFALFTSQQEFALVPLRRRKPRCDNGAH